MFDTITSELRTLETQENMCILFAIESGSRAWGFPSPDSDYDVRFVYAKPLETYLSIHRARDVIEMPIDGLLDINGWDIRKALGLLLKSNPVLLEWLSSPIRYVWDDEVCAALNVLANQIAHSKACIHHYLHLGERQFHAYIDGKDHISLKKYFYAVRPAMALRWIRQHPDHIPPMNFHDLVAGLDLDETITQKITELLVVKSRAKEMGTSAPIPIIDAFLRQEFSWAHSVKNTYPNRHSHMEEEANKLFRSIVNTRAFPT